MGKSQADKLIDVLITISTFLILLGAFFRLQHYPFGDLFLWIGFVTNLILSSFEIDRLKKIIMVLEKQA